MLSSTYFHVFSCIPLKSYIFVEVYRHRLLFLTKRFKFHIHIHFQKVENALIVQQPQPPFGEGMVMVTTSAMHVASITK